MSRGQTLRALVNERLTAAAEDIFVLFERTIAAYEEELCRSEKENQRKQHVLDKVLSSRMELVRGNVQIPLTPGPGQNQKITATPQITEEPEEQSIKQEEEQLPVPVPESSAVCVKTEESSLLQQRFSAHREEMQGEDISSEPHFHTETERHTEHSSDTDNDDHWDPFSFTAAQMETEADGDHYHQVHLIDKSSELSPQNKSAPETSVHCGHMSGADRGAEEKKYQCLVCNKRFGRKFDLQNHIRVHTGEKPYSCSICDKTFTKKGNLNSHKRTHTGDKPYSCAICKKTFLQKRDLQNHMRVHTGEKPYSCTFCEKTFTQKGNLNAHTRIHTGDKPYSCSFCKKAFLQKVSLNLHTRTHTGEKPYSCTVCKEDFADPSSLRRHGRIHTGDKPYSCSICKKTFAYKSSLTIHTTTHTEHKSYS